MIVVVVVLIVVGASVAEADLCPERPRAVLTQNRRRGDF